MSDSDEVPEGNKVSGRLVQRAGGDPQEHLPQAVRAGVDQLQPQQPHQDIQICLYTPVQHQVMVIWDKSQNNYHDKVHYMTVSN